MDFILFFSFSFFKKTIEEKQSNFDLNNMFLLLHIFFIFEKQIKYCLQE